MASDEAKIRELRPRQEDSVAGVQERRGGVSPIRAELIREDEEQNQKTIRRITEIEAQRPLPILERAAVIAERGQRLRQMAAFAGDQELELELGAVLRRLATAAEPARLTTRR